MDWNISKKTSYIAGNRNFFAKFFILNLRNKRQSIFARVIIRTLGTKGVRRSERKPKDTTSIFNIELIQFIFNFIKKVFCFNEDPTLKPLT